MDMCVLCVKCSVDENDIGMKCDLFRCFEGGRSCSSTQSVSECCILARMLPMLAFIVRGGTLLILLLIFVRQGSG